VASAGLHGKMLKGLVPDISVVTAPCDRKHLQILKMFAAIFPFISLCRVDTTQRDLDISVESSSLNPASRVGLTPAPTCRTGKVVSRKRMRPRWQPKVVSAVSLLGNEGGFFVFGDIELRHPVTGANLIQTGI
jgi:hypothetical protein